MFTKKLSLKSYFLPALFAAIIPLAVKMINMLLEGEVSDEEGVIQGPVMYFMVAAFSVITLSYGVFVLTFIIHLITNKGNDFTVDQDGIHNTTVSMNIFALIFMGRVRLIPWNAVINFHEDPAGQFSIKVKPSEVDADFLGKLILKGGYHFIPKLKDEEKEYIISKIHK